MVNVVTKTAKKTVKKAGKAAVKGGVSYAKGAIARAFFCWAIAAGIAALPAFGIHLPAAIAGYDTVAVVAFIIVGFLVYKRKLSIGRIIALFRTFG